MLITPDAKYGPCGLRKYVILRTMRYSPNAIMMIPRTPAAIFNAATIQLSTEFPTEDSTIYDYYNDSSHALRAGLKGYSTE